MTLLADLIDLVREDAELFGPHGACPTSIEDGANARLLLVTGGNGGGKSFLCKFLDANARDDDDARIEFMRVGMGRRTESGIPRAMMFGDEDRESTGEISAHVVLTGLETCRRRDKAHFLCLDEPDIGMSEENQGGLGSLIAAFAADMPALTSGLIVVTHSRHLARAVAALSPTCIRVGDDLRPTREWIAADPVPAPVEEFIRLRKAGHARMLAIKAVLDGRRAARSEANGARPGN